MQDLTSEFARGWLAGVGGITVGYPFETIKTKMQTGGPGASFVRELSNVVKKRGFLALFDGVASPIWSYGFLIATNFTCYSNLSRYLEGLVLPETTFQRSLCHAAAGFVSGGVLSVVSCPFEMVKLRLQNAAANVDRPAHFNSTLSCAKQMLRTEGLRGFYKGSALPVNFCVLSLGSALYFFTYDNIKSVFKPESFVSALAMGAVTGMIYWLGVFGMDTIKTRIMVDLASEKPVYWTIANCTAAVRKERGSWRRVFFGPGISAALMRAAPVNAVMLGVYHTMTVKKS